MLIGTSVLAVLGYWSGSASGLGRSGESSKTPHFEEVLRAQEMRKAGSGGAGRTGDPYKNSLI